MLFWLFPGCSPLVVPLVVPCRREVLIDLVEIPPNQRLEWHWHPGEEFHYYLEGNSIIERRDAPPIIGKPGTAGHVEFKQLH